jgi:hypothetical protein
MFLQEALGMDEADFAEGLRLTFFEFVSGDIDYTTLRLSDRGLKVILMNKVIKADPNLKEVIRAELLNTPIANIYDLDALRKLSQDSLNEIRDSFRNDGILCLTEDSNHLLMWAHYADQHRGAVMKFTPSVEKDSALLVARSVRYSDVRPALYQTPIDIVTHAMTMTIEQSGRKILDDLIYTKSSEWAYEKEYRLHIPGFIKVDEQYSTLQFHAEELTAICVGCRMREQDVARVRSLAKAINPSVRLLQARILPRKFKLDYVAAPDIQ